MRRAGVLLVLSACFAAFALAPAGAQQPLPDPNFAIDLLPRPCALENNDPFERETYKLEGWEGPDYERYPGMCRRMRFSYGPIAVKPGQNDVLVGPITTEKPTRDGYITRFKPNLVRADGTVPPVEQVHLHHATWLSEPAYGSGPFFAAGEEKTVAPFPRGYGMPIKATDQWQLLHMVHSAVAQPMEVFIVYDIDFVPKGAGDALGMKSAYPIWLDVRPSGYPVFNAQRSFGGADGECTWPREQCAAFDPYGKKIHGQGMPGNGKGEDWKMPEKGGELGPVEDFNGGTIIGMGGHLHPGGLQNEIDLVRPGRKAAVKRRAAKRRKARRRTARRCRAAQRHGRKRARGKKAARKGKRKRRGRRGCKLSKRFKDPGEKVRIYTGEPTYWDWDDPSKGGGPPTSWDFSMNVVGLPWWGVHVKPGDILRSNATYETRRASSYENMGIVVSLFVPNKPDGTPNAPGVDPFSVRRDPSRGCRSRGLKAKGGPRLCLKGIPTHGHLAENGNHSGPSGSWNARTGSATADVGIANFLYLPGDLTQISMTGVPTVKLGSKLRFHNADGHSIYHTVTSCKFPCLGQTSASFPLPDGMTSAGRKLDFDSSELGIGPPVIGPAKNELTWELPVTRQEGYSKGEVVTYFCRIHPSMRGAFEVTE